MGAFNVLDSVVSDSSRLPGVLDAVWALDDARNVWTGNEAQGTDGEIQFRASANIQLCGRLGTAVQVNRNWNNSGHSSFNRLDVTQIIEVSIFFLVKQVNPAVESNDDIVLQPLKDVDVLPATAGHNSSNVFSPTSEPDGGQELFEHCHIFTSFTYTQQMLCK